MDKLPNIFESNRAWAKTVTEKDPDFFTKLSKQQAPKILWIGCADSRVPATEICGVAPGEIFVHRNIANLVVHTDFNCLSVLQFAVEMLRVTDIVVCGHYGCGGIRAALDNASYGLIDNWLRNIKDVYNNNVDVLTKDSQSDLHIENRLCEASIVTQVANLSHTTVVQEAWSKGHKLNLHGWVYSLQDGLLKDLNVSTSSADQVQDVYRVTI